MVQVVAAGRNMAENCRNPVSNSYDAMKAQISNNVLGFS